VSASAAYDLVSLIEWAIARAGNIWDGGLTIKKTRGWRPRGQNCYPLSLGAGIGQLSAQAVSWVSTSAELPCQAEQAEREAAQMAECTFQPTLLARSSGRREEHAHGQGSAAAEAPVVVRGLNRHLELQAREWLRTLGQCLAGGSELADDSAQACLGTAEGRHGVMHAACILWHAAS